MKGGVQWGGEGGKSRQKKEVLKEARSKHCSWYHRVRKEKRGEQSDTSRDIGGRINGCGLPMPTCGCWKSTKNREESKISLRFLP